MPSLARTIRKLFRSKQTERPRPYQLRRESREDRDQKEPEASNPFTLRRWEAAQTTRLNKHLWQNSNTSGESINNDLAVHLSTLRARCAHERANNAMVDGVIGTHKIDVIGKQGPTLQVQSNSKRFNEITEQAVQEFMEMPDPIGEVDGVEMMRLWIDSLWETGEFLNVEQTFKEKRNLPFTLGIRTLAPRRLETPPSFAGDPDVAFGRRLNAEGATTQYYIEKTKRHGPRGINRTEYDPFPPEMVQLRYVRSEPDQLRGFPWLAPALPVVADLRDYDDAVMQAAKNAAKFGILLSTDHPDLDAYEVNECVEFESGTMRTLPPGYSAQLMDPNQPAVQYVEYRHERLRELGRIANMPLMMVLLSSADSNFSSAHYDGQIYMRGIEWLQSWISRRTLNCLIKKIIRELELAGVYGVPRKYVLNWTWPKPPYVNPKQMHDSLHARLLDGSATLSDVLASYSLDLETTIERRKQEDEQLHEAGLPTVTEMIQAIMKQGQSNGQQEEKPKSKPKGKANAKTKKTKEAVRQQA